MSGSFPGERFGFASGKGGMPQGLWDAMDQFRDQVEQRFGGGTRVGRGDVRAAVLALLAEQPMHGYQIIHEIEERSGGHWKPSPGSVYPTLQLLADEGLISAEETAGKKTYSLTEAGRAQTESEEDRSAPWEAFAGRDSGRGALPKAGMKLAQAAAQVGKDGTSEQIESAVTVLEEARRKLYAILAQD